MAPLRRTTAPAGTPALHPPTAVTKRPLSSPFRLSLALAVAAACLSLGAQAARLAMVVGNDNYQNVTKLRNAGNDAKALAREFETAGFTEIGRAHV